MQRFRHELSSVGLVLAVFSLDIMAGDFFGPPLLCLVALAGAWRERPGWWWLVALTGLGYALCIVDFTREVNLPLNRLTESWTPATLPADWASTRDAWNLANAWRAGWSALLFALGLAALYLHALGANGASRQAHAHRSATQSHDDRP